MTTLQLMMVDPASGSHVTMNVALPPSPQDPRDRLRRLKERLRAAIHTITQENG